MGEVPVEQSLLPSTQLAAAMVRERNLGVQRSTEVSPAKIKANQKNALRSTGPHTQRGKRIARENALKHGFFCKELLIRAGDGRESAEEFELLLHDLIVELRPEGRIEHMLVEQIASSLWRLRRIYQYETAEVRKQVDDAEIKLFLDREEEFSRLQSQLKIMAKVSPSIAADTRRELRRTSFGVDFVIGRLETLKPLIAEHGYLTEELEEWLFSCIETDEAITYCSSAARKAHASEAADDSEVRQLKEALLQWIEGQLKTYRARRRLLVRCDKSEEESHVATLLVPGTDTADKIARYEDTLLGRLYRALDRLERNQRRRRGEHVLPPITGHLSTNG